MLTTYIIIAIVLVFCTLVCYASCSAAARADMQSEKYIREKKSIMEGTYNNKNITINDNDQTKSYGWICPVCGRGNSPFTPTCPCKPWAPNWTITCEPAYKTTWTTSTTGGTINEAR